MTTGEWFTIQSGPDAGRVALVGWSLTALAEPFPTERTGPARGMAICPRCGAMVENNTWDRDQAVGRWVHLHEDWHAATDYPRP